MSSILEDASALEYQSRTPWPADAKLYHPYEAKQILPTDFARVMSVKTFLKMADLPFTVELRANAEYMSPSGKVPFIRAGNLMVSELEPIVKLAAAKGHDLSESLTEEQRVEQRAYMSLISSTLANAEEYLCWCDAEIFHRVTRPRYGHPFPWPLNVFLPRKKQYELRSSLAASGWAAKTTDQVYAEIETCCQALSEKLGDQQFFFGDKPTELDALVFGHLYTLLTVRLPTNRASQIVCAFSSLVAYCRAIEAAYFRDSQLQHED